MKTLAAVFGYLAGAIISWYLLHFSPFETIVVGNLIAIANILMTPEGRKK